MHFGVNRVMERKLIDVSTKVGAFALCSLVTTKTVSHLKEDNGSRYDIRCLVESSRFRKKTNKSLAILKKASRKSKQHSNDSVALIPSSLRGGMLLKNNYVVKRPLCQLLFDDEGNLGSNFYATYLLASGKKNIVAGRWQCEDDSTCTRDLSYDHIVRDGAKVDKNGCPLVRKVYNVHKVFETQTMYSPSDGVCVVDSIVSSPEVPFGSVFSTRVRYVIALDNSTKEERKEEASTNLEISHEVMWTKSRPFYAPALKRAVRKEVSRSFRTYSLLLDELAAEKKSTHFRA